jgi:hypothetical protein
LPQLGKKTLKGGFMRKVLVILAVLMMVSGCAALSSFLNSPAVNFICNPTAEQRADADKMLLALDTAQAIGAMFYPPLGIAQASAVLTTIKGGGCFVVAQLKAAFEAVDAANAAVVQAKGPQFAAEVKMPEYSSLRVLVK